MSWHDSRIDWPPPLGAPVTQCCHLDVEPYDPTVNDWEGSYGADVTIGVSWCDTWAEAIAYWRSETKLGPSDIAALDALEARYCVPPPGAGGAGAVDSGAGGA